MKQKMLAFFFVISLFTANAQNTPPDIVQTSMGPLTIQPIEHASMLLSVKGINIYVDPDGAYKFKGMASPNIIIITDIHGDHFNLKTIDSLKTANTVIVVPRVVADKLPAVTVLNNGESTFQSGITIAAIPMYNLPDGPSAAMHTKGRGNGYVLTIGGKKIYISGDTQGIPEMRALKNIDIAFVCMNLPYTMDVKEAADAVLAFKPAVVYPYHYRGQGGFSDVATFKSLVEAGNKKIEVRIRKWYPSQDK